MGDPASWRLTYRFCLRFPSHLVLRESQNEVLELDLPTFREVRLCAPLTAFLELERAVCIHLLSEQC